MGGGLSTQQKVHAQELYKILRNNFSSLKGNPASCSLGELEDLIGAIGHRCPWYPQAGTLDLQDWIRIGIDLHAPPRASIEHLLLWQQCKEAIERMGIHNFKAPTSISLLPGEDNFPPPYANVQIALPAATPLLPVECKTPAALTPVPPPSVILFGILRRILYLITLLLGGLSAVQAGVKKAQEQGNLTREEFMEGLQAFPVTEVPALGKPTTSTKSRKCTSSEPVFSSNPSQEAGQIGQVKLRKVVNGSCWEVMQESPVVQAMTVANAVCTLKEDDSKSQPRPPEPKVADVQQLAWSSRLLPVMSKALPSAKESLDEVSESKVILDEGDADAVNSYNVNSFMLDHLAKRKQFVSLASAEELEHMLDLLLAYEDATGDIHATSVTEGLQTLDHPAGSNETGSHSTYTLGMLEGLANGYRLIPQDWKDLFHMILTLAQCEVWDSECHQRDAIT